MEPWTDIIQGNQLRHDLNSVIGGGSNWALPALWAPLLRYVSGPILAIILSLAYPSFQGLNNDPLHVMGFIIGHFLLVWCVVGFLMPRWLDIFIVPERRDDWKQPIAPCLLRDTTEGEIADNLEAASPSDPMQETKQNPKVKDPLSDDSDPMDGTLLHDSGSSVTMDPRSDHIGKRL